MKKYVSSFLVCAILFSGIQLNAREVTTIAGGLSFSAAIQADGSLWTCA